MGSPFHQALTWSGTVGRQKTEQGQGEHGCACAGSAEVTGGEGERGRCFSW